MTPKAHNDAAKTLLRVCVIGVQARWPPLSSNREAQGRDWKVNISEDLLLIDAKHCFEKSEMHCEATLFKAHTTKTLFGV